MEEVTVSLHILLKNVKARNTDDALNKVKAALRDYIENNYDNVQELIDQIEVTDIIFNSVAYYKD